MPILRQTWMSVLTAITFIGCSSRGSIETLEVALRQQEDQLYQLQEQLRTTQTDLAVARNEATKLRQQLAGNGQSTLPPEHIENEFRAVGLRFNSYLTSGVNRDDQPGDESLSVLLYPHDQQGGLIKLPGSLELRAIDVTAPEGQQEVGHWTYSSEETRKAWHAGFLAAGYLLELPWQRDPSGATVTLHARFITTDGRQFDAVQPLKIQPPASNSLSGFDRRKVQAGRPIPGTHDQSEGQSSSVDAFSGIRNSETEELPPLAPIETSDRYREWEIPAPR